MSNQIVPSGSFVISEGKKEVLDAYLGTCVGITICDRSAGRGGLLHVLLPEPTGSNIPFQPEIYATEGLPLFLRALRQGGAHREAMIACVAGGALIGPVSDEDFSLDIGGRTTEVVQEILRREGIAVSHMETGGVFGCRLSLDLRTFQTTVEPLYTPVAQPQGEFSPLTPVEIDQAIKSVQPIPQIALRVIRMIRQDDHGMKDIALEVAQEQIISAKVINLCNSVLIGLGKRIDSVERALIALGEKKLLQLVVSASLETVLPLFSRGYSLCKGGIFHHAVGTGMVAQELAAFTGKSAPDTAYTAGLLHDIGKIPLDQYVTSFAPFFYRTIHEEGIELCRVEKEHFGVSHPEMGELLAERWELPENLVDVIANHHEPERATVDPDLVSLIYLSDLLMSRFHVGHELERLNTDKLVPCMERLGLGPDQFPILVDRMPRSVFDAGVARDLF